jgi:hypothetical protein
VHLNSITGMSSLNGAWTTVANKTDDTFELSATVNDSGVSITSDTTSAGMFSAGTCRRQVPGINDALVQAAADYASGDSASMEAALQWFTDDVQSGTRDNGSGSLLLGGGTIDKYEQTYFPDWHDDCLLPLNKKNLWYEGAYDGVTMLSTTAVKLGLTEETADQITDLIVAWKQSPHATAAIQRLYRSFMAYSTSDGPGQSSDVEDSINVGFVWSLKYGTIYEGTTFTGLLDGIRAFNNRKLRLRLIGGV